ncbi:penicillin-binding transpeptidase domain-containing protein [Desulfonatronospira sp.]|uniref:penicillin-binding transpeptidase domain-containing protein n=1 Tax=Desulfonatronospira sp. TaxID=1962951 RepID=UPI0025C5E7DA|nr:penicillin-binding transpeptidase domain-containing protein [Desulfonatronospira sp.]
MVKSRKHQGKETREYSRAKIGLVLAFCFIFWGALWARTLQVQVLQGQELAEQASRQYFSQEKIMGKRGEIFDRDGRVLAQSVRSKSVYANPFLMDDIHFQADELGRILNVDPASIRVRLGRKSSFVWLDRKISDRVAHEVASADIPGVFIMDEHSRVYPQKHMLGQVLGFVGIDNTGLEGLEKSLDERLSGAEMVMVMQRDASGQRFSLMPRQPHQQVDGEDIYLTIDSRIQFYVEQTLADAVKENSGQRGVAMVVHVPTGDILAWANYPFFNPNNYRASSPDIWRNRGATDLIEPGSTLKPFLVAAALEENVARGDSLYYCEQGQWRLGNNQIKDVREYGWLTVNRILRYSSNIGAAKVGMDLGPGDLHSYLTRLGLDQPTGVQVPGQSRGLLRPPGTWSNMDLATISFGQGMATSFLQLARAYATLGNHGIYTDLNILQENSSPVSSQQRVFSREVSRDVLAMMRDSVERDGTGTRARISGIEVGGKTGTAQKASPKGGYSDKYVASFVGFLPAMEPEYMIMVLVDEPENPYYGGLVAAPAFQRIGGRLLSSQKGQGLRTLALDGSGPATDAYTGETGRFSITPRQTREVDISSVPDLRGTPLRLAVESLIQAGIDPRIEGTGVKVHEQSPSPGSNWDSEEKQITLKLCSGS